MQATLVDDAHLERVAERLRRLEKFPPSAGPGAADCGSQRAAEACSTVQRAFAAHWSETLGALEERVRSMLEGAGELIETDHRVGSHVFGARSLSPVIGGRGAGIPPMWVAPPPAFTPWSDDHPDRGSADGLVATAAALAGVAAELHLRGDGFASAVGDAMDRWRGPAAEAWRASALAVLPEFPRLVGPAAAFQQAAARYRSDLADVATLMATASAELASHDDLVRREASARDRGDALAAAAAHRVAAEPSQAARARQEKEEADALLHEAGQRARAARTAKSAATSAIAEAIHARSEADTRFATTVLGALPVTAADLARGFRRLSGLESLTSAEEVRDFLHIHLGALADLTAASTQDIAAWWLALPAAVRTALIAQVPHVFGALDGIPIVDRIAANRILAAQRAAQLELQKKDLDKVGKELSPELAQELAYLTAVSTGQRQLYLYVPHENRIIEVVGDPHRRVSVSVVFVPGTMTSFADFYGGGVQQTAESAVRRVGDCIAFVYKDGLFPGEADAKVSSDLRWTTANPVSGVKAANDPDFVLKTGPRLSSFAETIKSDPTMQSIERSVAIGHSWGLVNIAAAESAGAHFDQVISLSGAGLPAGWKADQGTTYRDLSYNDILQVAQRFGVVWDGRVPRNEGAFEHGDYFAADETKYPILGVDRHDLATKADEPANRNLLDNLLEGINK